MYVLGKAYWAVATLAVVSVITSIANAAPITGGTGPGGIEFTNGASALQFWVRGDQGITQAAGRVSQWNDLSGYGRHGTQGVLVDQPSVVAGPNAQTAVEFGTGDVRHLALPSFTTGANFPTAAEAFFASRSIAVPGVNINGGMHAYGASGANTHHSWIDFNMYDSFFNNQRPATGTITAAQINNFYNYNISSTGTDWRNRLNGAALSNHATGTFTVPFTPLTLGEGGNGAGEIAWEGQTAEHFLYNRILNTAERRIVNNYLSSRYNMPLDPGEEIYSGDTGGNGNFDFGVTGVGRVDASNAVLNAGHDGIGFESTAGMANGEFVMAGHNNASGNNPAGRLNRAWYIDGTNLDGDEGLMLAIDPVDAGGLMEAGSTPVLLQATDSTLTSFNELMFGAFNGNDQAVFDLSAFGPLPDGWYTLGFQFPLAPEPSSFALFGVMGAGAACWAYRRRRQS